MQMGWRREHVGQLERECMWDNKGREGKGRERKSTGKH